MVMAPANTGRDRSNKTAVISTDHAKRGTRSSSIPNTRKLPKVLIKFTAPKMDLTPANEVKKWQSQQIPLHGQYFSITEDKLSNLYPRPFLGNIHGGHVEGLKHDLGHLLTV